jgi:hypothetical protein
MSPLPNVGRQREAQHLDAQLAALRSGNVLNRERVTLIVKCHGRALLGRVLPVRGGLLFMPAGMIRRNLLSREGQSNGRAKPAWARPDSCWFDQSVPEEIRARCRCHANPQIIETADMFDHIRRGERVMVVPMR